MSCLTLATYKQPLPARLASGLRMQVDLVLSTNGIPYPWVITPIMHHLAVHIVFLDINNGIIPAITLGVNA